MKTKKQYDVINEMKQTCSMLENSHKFATGDSEVKSQVKAIKRWTEGLDATFDKLEKEKENAKTIALVSSVLFLISSMLYIVALMILM